MNVTVKVSDLVFDMETLHAAIAVAKANDGEVRIDGNTVDISGLYTEVDMCRARLRYVDLEERLYDVERELLTLNPYDFIDRGLLPEDHPYALRLVTKEDSVVYI